MNKKIDGFLFLIAGILFFIAAFIGKDYINIPLGCCFIALSLSKRKKGD